MKIRNLTQLCKIRILLISKEDKKKTETQDKKNEQTDGLKKGSNNGRTNGLKDGSTDLKMENIVSQPR